MKRSAKILVSLLLLCAMLCGCSAFQELQEDQTLTFQDLTITLPGYFQDLTDPNAGLTEGFMYGVSEIAVIGIRESYDLFDGFDGLPAPEEYGNMIIQSNNLDALLQEQEGMLTFTYTNQVDGTSYSYLAGIFAGTDAFWLVQIGCQTRNFEESRENFLNYLKSVAVA